jgi:hypothetical protein
MRRGPRNPPSMGEVLGEFLRRTGINRKIQEQKILNSWEEAVGEGIAERTQPIRVQNRVLQVKVANSVWMQELQFMKELILQKLHRQAGKDLLQDLRFFIGEIEPSGGKDKNKKKERALLDGLSSGLSEAERERIDRTLSDLADPELREILGRIYAKGLASWKFR